MVVAPGRGTYNRDELGYLSTHHTEQSLLISQFDSYRAALSQQTLLALDGAVKFSPATHTRGDNASPLIYACSYFDFLAINRNSIDIIAITGNSMGWYTALACAEVLNPMGGFELVNTMGSLMQDSMIGGQLIYPFVDENWIPVEGQREGLLDRIRTINDRDRHTLTVSIDLGGMLVIAGDHAGLDAFEEDLPRLQERFPLRLPNHAAFHSHLQIPVAEQGRARISVELFGQPRLPLIDGRGYIWHPKSTPPDEILDYTLNHQIIETYDFTKAIRTAAREFMPDIFIILGPGNTLGGATAQSLALCGWRGVKSRSGFQKLQQRSECLISMGDEKQRRSVVCK